MRSPKWCLALSVAILTLAGLEGSARVLMRHLRFAHCYDSPKNPTPERNWAQFTAPRPRPANQRLVILISNSQGYGREMRDPAAVYSVQLETLLKAGDPRHDYKVVNWAMNGGGGPEMAVLAARAVAHEPDAILLVSYSDNFVDGRATKPLSFARTDVRDLAYEPQVRRTLSPWFLDAFTVNDPGGYLSRHVALTQLRNAFLITPRELIVDRIVDRPFNTLQPWQLRGAELLEEIYRLSLLTSRAELFVVSMPLCHPRFDQNTFTHAYAFSDAAHTLFDGKPRVTVLDALYAVPTDEFLTMNHFTEAGHSDFAGWLAERLKPVLYGKPGARGDAV